MMDLDLRRRFFAEEIEALAGLQNGAVVDALASIPRERFLRPGPWTIRSEADFASLPRQTPDGDPRHVYHNYVVGIDPGRQLFNGQPSLLAMAIDSLGLKAGSRVLHVGAGLGYYTAILAHVVGPNGRVLAIEVDGDLAREARANLESMPGVEVRQGDASGPLNETFDGMLINAGVTHPRREWVDALACEGRMVLPLTAAMPLMGATIGKGLLVHLARKGDPSGLDARVISFVAIYSAVGLRDDGVNEKLGKALAAMPFPRLKRLRLDSHEPESGCWLHVEGGCLST
jgi:protein-L-isoaspartate(D-aspartate) O-methyltransferase